MTMISQWLSYLGVKADVTYLHTHQGKIQISLTVNKPDQCSEPEWMQILTNINQSGGMVRGEGELTYAKMSPKQQGKVHRLLAHVIQAGDIQTEDAHTEQAWEHLRPFLVGLGMDESLLSGIKAALKVPAMLDLLLEDLDTEVAAFVLSKAIGIALIDQQISQEEDSALKAIYRALENKAKA